MTEEEMIQKEQDFQEQIANLEKDKENLVEEIKGERTKKQEETEGRLKAEKELEDSQGEEGDAGKEFDPEDLVNRALLKRDEEDSKDAFEQAKSAMKNIYKEYSDEADSAGIVFNKFESELKKFNMAGLKTKDQYLSMFQEVHEFMNRGKKQSEENTPHYSGTPQGGSDAAVDDHNTLSEKELKVMKSIGWDKERFLKQKAAHPAFVSSLVNKHP